MCFGFVIVSIMLVAEAVFYLVNFHFIYRVCPVVITKYASSGSGKTNLNKTALYFIEYEHFLHGFVP